MKRLMLISALAVFPIFSAFSRTEYPYETMWAISVDTVISTMAGDKLAGLLDVNDQILVRNAQFEQHTSPYAINLEGDFIVLTLLNHDAIKVEGEWVDYSLTSREFQAFLDDQASLPIIDIEVTNSSGQNVIVYVSAFIGPTL